jgi:hypothetical protein
MVDFNFPACATCIHMQVVSKNGTKEYYCELVTDDIPNGLIHPTFDADKCIKKGRYVVIKR